jgi:DNA polymerase/3'-5' exonuclease PolX
MHEENKSPSPNPYKVNAFTTAIRVLKQLDHKVRSTEEVKKVSLYIIDTSSADKTQSS